MRVLTAAEMRAVDSWAITEIGIPSLVLMENAGVQVVQCLQQEFGDLCGKRVFVLAGKGNNGGDGLVIARHLLNKGAKVKVYLWGRPGDLSYECQHNLEIFEKLNGEIQSLNEPSLSKLRFSLGMADLIIDSLLGVGAVPPLEGALKEIVEIVNKITTPVVAVDIPSGIDATTGKVEPTAVRADLTVTLGYLKQGMLLYPAAEYVGRYQVVDIGIPPGLDQEIQRFLATEQVLTKLPTRPRWGHKGTFGHGLIVAGSRSMAGAACLAGQAMLRSGAGMVTLAVPESIAPLLPASELMVHPLPETSTGRLGSVSIEPLLKLLSRKNCLVIGPGLSRETEVGQLVYEVLDKWEGPAVVDADALYFLGNMSGKPIKELMVAKAKQWVLTPHPGEMAQLVNLDIPYINQARLDVATDYHKEHQAVLLLKGAPTVIAGSEVYLNSTGNPGMGTAGMGDVLSGIIGALLCQGLTPQDAAVVGAYVHGKAGDLAAQHKGMRSMIASDIMDYLPQVLG